MPEEKEKKFAKDFLEKWARAEREEGPADEALKAVDEALKEKPEDPTLWFRRGSLLTDLERWEEALEAFRRVEGLDPSFPRVYVGLAFVLNRLGRTAEAAEAQGKAVEAEGGERPGPEPEVEELLDRLAEDLAHEARADAAVEGLEELGALAGEPGVPDEEDFAALLAKWEAEGFDVRPLRDVMEREPDRTRTAFFQFDHNVRKVHVLRDTVDALDPEGLEEDIARMRSFFRAPYQIWRIEAEMATLMEKADARDRARRPRIAPAPEPRARVTRPPAEAGRINGLVGPPARVPGMGRVNGQVNGLINGVARARAGMTNGLTNGLGFTNGLGGHRFRSDSRARRGRLLLIPTIAVLLLSLPLLLPPEPTPPQGGIPIDGSFSEWQRVPGYTQPPSGVANDDVDLREYKAFFQDHRLSVYARVGGVAFGDPSDLDLAHAYLDTDGDRATGYDQGRVGAELLVEIQGGNGTVESAQAWNWSGMDRADWSGWQGRGLAVLAVSEGAELEFQIDLTDDPTFDRDRAAVFLAFEDQGPSHSASAVVFGPRFGALNVRAASATDLVLAGALQDFLLLSFHAIGAPVNVTDVVFTPDPGLTGPKNLTLAADETRIVPYRIDPAGYTSGTLLVAGLLDVDADRPVTIAGDEARAYVDTKPTGKVVDGLFDEWTNVSTDLETVDNPNVDVREYGAEVEGGVAFSYVQVVGEALEGGDASWRRTRPLLGGPAAAPGGPAPSERQGGEDTLRVYYDTNATEDGVRVGTITADALLQISGRHGRVREARAFVWGAGWMQAGTGEALAVGSELEASASIPGLDLRGAGFLIEARDWRGTRDVTDAGGVRGTRSTPDGLAITGDYDAWLPARSDGWFRFARGASGVSWRLPGVTMTMGEERTLVATPESVPVIHRGYLASYVDAFAGLDLDVAYAAGLRELKETLVLGSPPNMPADSTLLFEFPLAKDEGIMVRATGEETALGFRVRGDLQFVDGRGISLRFLAPWAEDAEGRRIDLAYLLGPDSVGIGFPSSWLMAAAYPVTIDPTSTYQLENDNANSNDAQEQFGWSSAMGDFNGDGYADVLVGAPNNNRGGNAHGYAYVFYGPFTADDSSPDVEINGTTSTARFGYSVAAGKFNNDNFWDLLISRLATTIFPGDTAIYYGSASGPDTTADVTFTYPSTPQNFGWAVAAGNLNNADYDDVLIGEEGRDNDGGLPSQDGAVHVYLSPFDSTESSSNYTLLPSNNTAGHFGRAIAVGKIDSDAYPDVVVGEPNYLTNVGRAHFFKGSHFTSGSGNVSPDATLGNQSAGERFGAALAIGLLDGDAYADLVVGAPLKNTNAGGAYIFLANADGTGLTTGASASVTIPNQTSGENFGTSVLVVDFDGDGTPGVFVGAPLADTGGTDRGAAYWFDAPVSDQTVDETINGGQNGESLGQSLSAGKFNLNTRTIVAIGAYLWDDGGDTNSGRVLVAEVPEPAMALVAAGVLLVLGGRSLQRRRLVRKG